MGNLLTIRHFLSSMLANQSRDTVRPAMWGAQGRPNTFECPRQVLNFVPFKLNNFYMKKKKKTPSLFEGVYTSNWD